MQINLKECYVCFMLNHFIPEKQKDVEMDHEKLYERSKPINPRRELKLSHCLAVILFSGSMEAKIRCPKRDWARIRRMRMAKILL